MPGLPNSQPLTDLRIVSVEQFGAGPWATMQLADLGAEVIKIEDPASAGDVGRSIPPYRSGESSLYFESFNRNKLSVSLDLRAPAGREVFEDVVRQSDAVFSNLRGDQPGRLGLTYADLASVNPRIVCCSLTGFGRTGPRAAQGAYDHTVQALAGWMSLTGGPDAPPARSGVSLADYCAGYVSALALMAGVWRARRDGAGCDCDISLLESALSNLNYVATWTLTEDFVAQRHADSAHPSIVPFQAFRAADGWFTVACPKEKFWLALCEAIDRSDLAADERYADFAGRHANRDAVVGALNVHFLTQPAAHWVQVLSTAGVPCAPVASVADALADEQVAARDGTIEYEHSALGQVRQVATPLRLSGPPAPVRRGPLRGEHTDVVLRTICGYGDERISALRAAGAFGAPAGARDWSRPSDSRH